MVLENSDVVIKEFTVQQVFEALKKNGFEHIREMWFDTDYGKPTAACVLGQAALNLSAAPETDQASGRGFFGGYDPEGFQATVYDQLNRFRNPIPDEIVPEGDCGSAIVQWNDSVDHYEDDEEETPVYTLPTYEAVVNKAEEILRPYFDEVVYLQVMEY